MSLTLDHVVILVRDLDTAVADYTSLGFTVVPGGTHADGATHNALVAFADGTYLELIAFLRDTPEHSWWRHMAAGEGLIDYALLPTNTSEDIAAARRRGLELDGPIPGGRKRPDGQVLEWETGRAHTPDLPFLCGDVTPRSLRVPSGATWEHANDAQGIAGLTVAVTNLPASARRYQSLLGSAPIEADTVSAADIATVQFQLGTTTLTLAAPTHSAPASTPLRVHLAQRGEGPYALTLRSEQVLGNASPRITHGVRLGSVEHNL